MPNLVHKGQLVRLVNQPLILLSSGQVSSALAGLIYGKLTANYIPPSVWGEYSLLLIISTLSYNFFIAPVLQSFKAALTQFSQRQTITFYNQLLIRRYFVLGSLTLLAGLYCQNSLFVLIWVAAVGQGVYQYGINYLNASEQHRWYVLMQAGYAIGTVLVSSLIIIGFNQRSVSGLWQTLVFINIPFATLSALLLITSARATSFTSITVVDSVKLRSAHKQYVWPLLSLAFWGWLINYADRYLIRFYLTDADVGQYSMGYSLGSKPLLLVAPLLAFLSPQVLRSRATRQPLETANLLIQYYLIRYVLAVGLGCLGFYLGREWIGQFLLSDVYEPAFLVGPVVAIEYLFLTSVHLLELKWYAFGQTKFVLWHNVLGAVLHIGFNVLLIPRMGIVGAALATLLGFAGQFLFSIWLFTSAKLTTQ